MGFLDTERASLDQHLPGFAERLEQAPLEDREGGAAGIRAFRAAGGPALLVPAENKGIGATAREAVRVQRAVGSMSPSLAVGSTMHHFSIASLVETHRVSQGPEWMLLEAIATENQIVASGFAEGIGRSVLRPTLRGTRTAQGYRLNGTKKPCSLAHSMDLLTASVLLDDEQPGVAVVPAGTPGLRVEPFWSAPVLRGAESEAVVLEDVLVDESLVVAVGSIDPSSMDSVQAAGFLWFELLMTAGYLGMGSALVQRVVEEGRGSAGEQADLVSRSETAAAAVELVAADLDREGPGDALLQRALLARYTAQELNAAAVAKSVELLGGINFIRDPFVQVFADSSRCLAFHPPSRSRAAEALVAAFKGAPLLLS